jgi:hypothetical protein
MAINRAKHGRTRFVPPPPDQPPSDAQLDVFFAVYEETFCEYEARKAARIGRKALAQLHADPAFKDRLAELNDDSEYRARLKAKIRHEVIVKGTKELVLAESKAEFPERYGARASLQLNVDVTKLSTEELDQLIERHSKGR